MTNTNDPVDNNTKDAHGHAPSDTALGQLNKPGGQPTVEEDEDGSHETPVTRFLPISTSPIRPNMKGDE
jgi:hypothetical protein